MSETVIQVNNLSKQYRLGSIGTGTLSHDLKQWWYSVKGKENPYFKIGEQNIREVKGESEYVWALKDVSFEVKRGEVLGIIGKNGAGKSTLLKILSRVTTPSIGEFKVKGRIASLLEVGTGFHPELTGKENIFLNGAILGMTKTEIKSKFDEIVTFSGVERYIDTPVKRYSSGMYVRLAFAVAAHLEPEILIIDEVLAVGDAEFQKKCLGKMKDVSGEGRTVLFVSHNIGMIQKLCTKSILLERGKTLMFDDVNSVVNTYLTYDSTKNAASIDLYSLERKSLKESSIIIKSLKIYNSSHEVTNSFKFGESFSIAIEIFAKSQTNNVSCLIGIDNMHEQRIFTSYSDEIKKVISMQENSQMSVRIIFEDLILNPGTYKVHIGLHRGKIGTLDLIMNAVTFTITDLTYKNIEPFRGNWGIFRYNPKWVIPEPERFID